MGLAILIVVLLGFSSFPVVLYLWDGLKENNIKKGVFYSIGFFVSITLGFIFIKIFGIWLAMATPLLLVLLLVISHFIKQSKT